MRSSMRIYSLVTVYIQIYLHGLYTYVGCDVHIWVNYKVIFPIIFSIPIIWGEQNKKGDTLIICPDYSLLMHLTPLFSWIHFPQPLPILWGVRPRHKTDMHFSLSKCFCTPAAYIILPCYASILLFRIIPYRPLRNGLGR